MVVLGTRLASILNSEIDGQTDDSTSRADVIARMARAASISSSTVNQILGADINCPPIDRLEGFAQVLGVSMSRLRSAAESDGCEYSDGNNEPKCCRLNISSKIMNDIEAIQKSL